MFRLRDLIWLDDQYTSGQGYQDCLGDRYLCARNKLFNTLRYLFLGRGGEYRCATEFELGRRYLVSPLLCLNDILESSVIPYKANRASAEAIVARNATLALPGRSLVSLIGSNFLMHETAHCVSYMLNEGKPELEPKDSVAEAICSEAFANTVERLAAAEVKSPTDALFYLMNSYITHVQAAPLIRHGIEELGFSGAFALAMTCYACANLCSEPPLPETVLDFLVSNDFIEGHVLDSVLIKKLIGEVFTLSGAFREQTSLAYFRMLGLEDAFESLRSGPFNDVLIEKLGLRAKIDLHLRQIVDALSSELAARPAAV